MARYLQLEYKFIFILTFGSLVTKGFAGTALKSKQIVSLREQRQYQKQQQNSYGQPAQHFPFSCSESFGISVDLAMAATEVMSFVDITDFYAASQNEEDICLLQSLWEKGYSLKSVTASHWWSIIENMSYKQTSQHLLIGTLNWIITTLQKINQLYSAGSLSSHRTKWIWIVTDSQTTYSESTSNKTTTTTTNNLSNKSTSPAVNGERLPSAPSASVSDFNKVSRDLSALLGEYFEGVFLIQENRKETTPPSSESYVGENVLASWVSVGSVDLRDAQNRQLSLAATWSDSILRVMRPLWPKPIFNFQGRNIPISCLKKASVFEFSDDDLRLSDAKGYLAEVTKIMMEGLNVTATLVPTQGGGSKNQDGSWNGIVGVLTREEADIGALDFTPSLSRSQVVDFSIPIGQDPTVIVSSAPFIVIKPFLLLQIFSPTVWGCLVGLVLLGSYTLWILQRIESKLGFNKVQEDLTSHFNNVDGINNIELDFASYTNFFMTVFKMFVLQSSRYLPNGNAGRLVTALIMLVALIVGALYNGSVTAFLVIPFKSKPINSVDDLLSTEVIPTVRSKTNIQTYTVNQEGGALYKARSKVAVMSGSEVSTLGFHDKMAQGSYALVDVYSAAMGRANKFTKRGEPCKFHVGRENIQVNPDALAFRRNSPYLRQLDFIIRSLQYFGIMEYVKNKHVTVLCEADLSNDGPKPMSLLQAQGPFIILGVGLMCSILVLVVEILI